MYQIESMFCGPIVVGRSFGVAARNTYLVQGCDVCNAKFRVYFVLCRREIKPISVPTLFALRVKRKA